MMLDEPAPQQLGQADGTKDPLLEDGLRGSYNGDQAYADVTMHIPKGETHNDKRDPYWPKICVFRNNGRNSLCLSLTMM